MPSKKRRRAVFKEQDASNRAVKAHFDQAASLEGFSVLPVEIKVYIFELACQGFSSVGESNDAPDNQDLRTMISLSLVSHEFRTHVLPSLYKHLSITRPSSLYALSQVLQAHPQRAAFIKSLHIGPRGGPLPAHWWPLTYAYAPGEGHFDETPHRVIGQPCNWLATTLEKEDLPSGCASRQSWALSAERRPSGCRDAAIHEALIEAGRSLDIDLAAASGTRSELFPPGTAWLPRILEVQAALDLFLKRLHDLERESPELVRLANPGARIPLKCRGGHCDHYPSLVVTGPPSSPRDPPQASNGVFYVSRGDLLRHLARPGGITDRFDHPLTLARSGFEGTIIQPPGYGTPSYREADNESGARYELRSESWDLDGFHEDSELDGLEMLHEEDELCRQCDQTEGPLTGPLSTATFGSTLRLARSVLKRLTSLSNLSFTGYLERAIAHGQAIKGSLRRLTIGPAPPCWNGPLAVEYLEGIRELRICGAMLTAEGIENMTTLMKHVRLIEWSVPNGCQWPGGDEIK